MSNPPEHLVYCKGLGIIVRPVIVLQCATYARHVFGAVGTPITVRCVVSAEAILLETTGQLLHLGQGTNPLFGLKSPVISAAPVQQ